jgi:hypothetical protein
MKQKLKNIKIIYTAAKVDLIVLCRISVYLAHCMYHVELCEAKGLLPLQHRFGLCASSLRIYKKQMTY